MKDHTKTCGRRIGNYGLTTNTLDCDCGYEDYREQQYVKECKENPEGRERCMECQSPATEKWWEIGEGVFRHCLECNAFFDLGKLTLVSSGSNS